MRKDNTKEPAAAQQDMIRLIKSIKRELSGGAGLEWNEHLETELRRYREFSKSTERRTLIGRHIWARIRRSAIICWSICKRISSGC